MNIMNNDSQLFELITKMYSEMQKGFKEVKTEIAENRNAITKVESKIENDITAKLEALFDGYVQNSQKLDRIEEEVTKHEEVILRRIK